MNTITSNLQNHWRAIEPLLTLRNEEDYVESVERLNALIDEVGTNEQHPLYTLLDTLGILIHAYEQQHHSMPDCSGGEMLVYLMEEHQIAMADLSDIGSPEAISQIIDGRQSLTIQQVHMLAERFHVSPAVFV